MCALRPLPLRHLPRPLTSAPTMTTVLRTLSATMVDATSVPRAAACTWGRTTTASTWTTGNAIRDGSFCRAVSPRPMCALRPLPLRHLPRPLTSAPTMTTVLRTLSATMVDATSVPRAAACTWGRTTTASTWTTGNAIRDGSFCRAVSPRPMCALRPLPLRHLPRPLTSAPTMTTVLRTLSATMVDATSVPRAAACTWGRTTTANT